MNGMNQFNQMNNNQNMINCPCKAIINSINVNEIKETSFINSVLQIFASLDCVMLWYNSNKNMMKFPKITKELFTLLTSLYSGQKPDSSNIILHYENILKSIFKTNVKEDPYEFMLYFLEIIHSENNNPPNPTLNENILNNQELQNRKNSAYMYNLYSKYFAQTQNSIISQNFFSILKYEMSCQNCSHYYNYNYKAILEFDIDKYREFRDQAFPEKKSTNLTMDDCFINFCGGNNNQCIFCNNNGLVFTRISTQSKVLIIALKRNNHNFYCDVNFKRKLNIANYCFNDSGINF
jgi:hypothetical protein